MKAVIFDCFGVLYVDASRDFYEKSVANYEQLRPQLMELNAQSDYGLISQQEWVEQVAEVTGLPVDEVGAKIQSNHTRNDGLISYMASLRQRGYLIGMISNIGPGAMDNFFSPRERDELFDAVVLSGDVMVTKPSPVIFQLGAERLGVDTGDCIMIDDLSENCNGADAAGMQAVQYLSNQQTIRNVEDILHKM